MTPSAPAPMLGRMAGRHRALGGSAYAGVLPPGKHWLRETQTGVAAAVGLPLSSSQQIQELNAASAIRRAGITTVGGVRTEYRFLLDPTRLSAKAKASSLLGKLGSVLGHLQMPMRLWVEANGLPVREEASFQYEGATVDLHITSAYGNAVVVAAPPARLVGQAPAGAGGAGGTA